MCQNCYEHYGKIPEKAVEAIKLHGKELMEIFEKIRISSQGTIIEMKAHDDETDEVVPMEIPQEILDVEVSAIGVYVATFLAMQAKYVNTPELAEMIKQYHMQGYIDGHAYFTVKEDAANQVKN